MVMQSDAPRQTTGPDDAKPHTLARLELHIHHACVRSLRPVEPFGQRFVRFITKRPAGKAEARAGDGRRFEQIAARDHLLPRFELHELRIYVVRANHLYDLRTSAFGNTIPAHAPTHDHVLVAGVELTRETINRYGYNVTNWFDTQTPTVTPPPPPCVPLARPFPQGLQNPCYTDRRSLGSR